MRRTDAGNSVCCWSIGWARLRRRWGGRRAEGVRRAQCHLFRRARGLAIAQRGSTPRWFRGVHEVGGIVEMQRRIWGAFRLQIVPPPRIAVAWMRASSRGTIYLQDFRVQHLALLRRRLRFGHARIDGAASRLEWRFRTTG